MYDAQATDLDSTQNSAEPSFSQLSYRLLGDPTAVLYFSMNPSTGVITTSRSLLGQADTSYLLEMQVGDEIDMIYLEFFSYLEKKTILS